MRRKHLLTDLMGLAIYLCATVTAGCQPPRLAASGAMVTPLPVNIVTLMLQESYTTTSAYVGRVQARRASPLGFERGGRVRRVLLDEGQCVQRGQLLATLDTRELRARRRQVVAQRAAARARLSYGERQRNRTAKLAIGGYATPSELDQVSLDARAQTAELAALDAALDAAEIALAQSRLLAPFGGCVARRLVDEGTVVPAGKPIVQLVEMSGLELRVSLPDDLGPRLPINSEQTVRVRGQTVRARVARLLPAVSVETHTITVVLELPGDIEVPLQSVVRLELPQRHAERGFWLPLSALAEGRRGLWTAYVLRRAPGQENGLVERAMVELIHVGADRVFARGTLQNGDQIVADGLHRLVPGMKVRPVRSLPPVAAVEQALPRVE